MNRNPLCSLARSATVNKFILIGYAERRLPTQRIFSAIVSHSLLFLINSATFTTLRGESQQDSQQWALICDVPRVNSSPLYEESTDGAPLDMLLIYETKVESGEFETSRLIQLRRLCQSHSEALLQSQHTSAWPRDAE
jgi:hypothetical protein